MGADRLGQVKPLSARSTHFSPSPSVWLAEGHADSLRPSQWHTVVTAVDQAEHTQRRGASGHFPGPQSLTSPPVGTPHLFTQDILLPVGRGRSYP